MARCLAACLACCSLSSLLLGALRQGLPLSALQTEKLRHAQRVKLGIGVEEP